MEEFGDEEQDAIQRLLNDAKRTELEERYGMRFSRIGNSEIHPELEAQWLDHIAEFQRCLEGGEQITLREFVGFPEVRPLKEIDASEIEGELERLLDQLAEHEVFVDFPDSIEAALAYRFVAEELLDEEICDIRMPGMRLHFVFGDPGA
jgi:hypothetical protein